MDQACQDAADAYETLHRHPSPHNYRLSLGYLSMSSASYMEAWQFYVLHEDIQHYEIDPVFRAYEAFKRQMKQVITNNDRAGEPLAAAYETLQSTYREASEFIESSM
ncbi:hypothetical protein [Paenibacillus daejeonensis]|uniref:hypothetical protein n=1 Tax=Paenibacillus daejeonensis TaxID=135193 RepID=UPI00037AA53B|nr:hypothetical protein [Paenibacillus daejeonensis]